MRLSRLFYALPVGLFLLAQACNPLAAGGASGGQCTTADGNVVNTYTVFGSWKKITGYTTPRSKSELELNYDVLLVQAGTPFCITEIVNQAQGDTISRGTYVQDIRAKTIDFTYTEGTGSTDSASATKNTNFSFSGSCDSTVMTLNYEDGTLEKYQVLSKDTASINCNPTN